MTGYLILALLGALAFGALVAFRLPRLAWSIAGAALFLGATGYAWQGRPGLPAHPATPSTRAVAVEPEVIALRDRLMGGRFTADGAYLVASDAMLRTGDTAAATQVVLGGIRAIPHSYILWTQLGTNFALHDGDRMSPAALAAFRQAMRLAPKHPAPPYYMGLAFLRAGDFAAAVPLWRRALALSAPKSDYQQEIARQLAVLERVMQLAQQQGAAPPPR
ncbi:tetratricopeptide repeat protein [Sphingomonas lycopersici]|uniref:Cytochrome C biosynthesis protein n=1 Tax=Sphingomonas lycopersici TaxID=2951807 RepID=A0AA41Z9H1_9SPHN|nr:hypothetical protein [Sphingomonas lycopersici]MCW6535257.1 hypothetical protein [Sphingomonas lycopersici]